MAKPVKFKVLISVGPTIDCIVGGVYDGIFYSQYEYIEELKGFHIHAKHDTVVFTDPTGWVCEDWIKEGAIELLPEEHQ